MSAGEEVLQSSSEADRIVTVQRRMQAVSVAFLQPVLFGKEPFVLRALQPSEDRVTLSSARRDTLELERLVHTMGRLLAWAHLRSSGLAGSATADELVDFGQRRKWRAKLLQASVDCASQVHAHSKTFDAACDAGAFGVAPQKPARRKQSAKSVKPRRRVLAAISPTTRR